MKSANPNTQPKVGVFWIFKGKLLKFETAVDDGTEYGGVVNGRFNHIDYWPMLQRRNPELRLLEYQEVPRGRVMFIKKTKKFRVLMDKVLHTPRNKQSLLKAFNLPKTKTAFGTDPHYTTDAAELDRLFAR